MRRLGAWGEEYEIASHIGVTVTETTRREFANGELFIRPNDSVRGTDAFVIQAHTTPINDWLMESLILVENAESPLVDIQRELTHERGFSAAVTILGDVKDGTKMRHVFERYSETLGARVFAHELGVDRIECTVTDPISPGQLLPGGIEAIEAKRADEVVLWLPDVRALVTGDVLLGRDGGLRLCPPSWVGGEEKLEQARLSLRVLLDLPVEMVLTSHGPPVMSEGREALATVLA